MSEAVAPDPGPAQDPGRGEPAQAPRTWTRMIPAVVLLAFAVTAIVLSSRMAVGTPIQPGPGMWPLTVSVLLAAFSALLVLTKDHDGHETWERGALRVLAAVVSLAVFIVLFSFIGFTLPAIAMSLLWLRAFGGERWRSAALLAVVAPVLLYLLFDEFLGVRLPQDLLMSTILGV